MKSYTFLFTWIFRHRGLLQKRENNKVFLNNTWHIIWVVWGKKGAIDMIYINDCKMMLDDNNCGLSLEEVIHCISVVNLRLKAVKHSHVG